MKDGEEQSEKRCHNQGGKNLDVLIKYVKNFQQNKLSKFALKRKVKQCISRENIEE